MIFRSPYLTKYLTLEMKIMCHGLLFSLSNTWMTRIIRDNQDQWFGQISPFSNCVEAKAKVKVFSHWHVRLLFLQHYHCGWFGVGLKWFFSFLFESFPKLGWRWASNISACGEKPPLVGGKFWSLGLSTTFEQPDLDWPLRIIMNVAIATLFSFCFNLLWKI